MLEREYCLVKYVPFQMANAARPEIPDPSRVSGAFFVSGTATCVKSITPLMALADHASSINIAKLGELLYRKDGQTEKDVEEQGMAAALDFDRGSATM